MSSPPSSVALDLACDGQPVVDALEELPDLLLVSRWGVELRNLVSERLGQEYLLAPKLAARSMNSASRSSWLWA